MTKSKLLRKVGKKTVKSSSKKRASGSKKKYAKKKTVKKQELHPDNYFYIMNGDVIKDLYDLADSLDEMTDEVFSYHVNDEKNDFSNWIRNVIEEPVLAEDIIEIRDPIKTQVVILKHIVKKMR